jgi:hypothetical protein
MSISFVRRLTATFVLAAVLCLASPATAAPTSDLATVILSPGLFDRILAWLDSSLGDEPPRHERKDSRGRRGSADEDRDPGPFTSVTVDPNG